LENAIVLLATDRQIDTRTDKTDFIICPLLLYSNGTDNKITHLIKVLRGIRWWVVSHCCI